MCVTTQHYWRSSAVPFVELRSTYDSLQSYKPHFHAEFSFGAMISGATRANCKGRDHILSAGDLVLIAPHAVHSCNPIAGQPRSYHMLYVNEAWCLETVAGLRGRSMAGIRMNKNPALFAEYLDFVMALPCLRAYEANDRLRQLLAAAVEPEAPAVSLLHGEALAEQIKQALLESIATPVSLDELARKFECRKETLIRVFRRTFHITPHAFLNNVRVEQAKQRLKRGEDIADVAADLGFSDQSQLHRTFVNYTASTPGQYRRGPSKATINFRQ